MCGIVGYIGKREAAPILMEGLSRMEYRGYDSAGIAVVSEKGLVSFKNKGRVSVLKEMIARENLAGHVGIAHTRWATHGVPNQVNAHPHGDCKGEIFVVHNGIIENYMHLKTELKAEGHSFVSDTDTEVLAHLIEKYFTNDLASAVQQALKKVTGAYGIAVVAKNDPDHVVAARFGSPLILGVGPNELIVASDLTAILPITQKVVYLEDGEMVVLNKEKYTITDSDNTEKAKETEQVDWTLEAAEKGGFPHFMLKEIFEQPEAIKNSIRGRLDFENNTTKLGGLESIKDRLSTITNLRIVGMGTARLAGMIGEYMIEEYARINVKVDFGSEYTYRQAVPNPKRALLAISQSGETIDTLLAIKEAKRQGMLTLGIVNVTGSSVARETDAGVYNHIGPEIAVASTKAFVSQVTVLALLSVYFGRMKDMSVATGQRIVKEMQDLPAKVDEILDTAESIKLVAEKYKGFDHFFFLGRKYNFPVALEGALKLKEVAYVHAEGYNAAEMKHGPIALIDENFPSFVIAPSDSVYEKNIGHIREIKARGGKVIALATVGNEEIKTIADDVIYIPKTLEMLTPILAVIPLQLFAYYIAVARGCDVDKPRNLAKSVTVE